MDFGQMRAFIAGATGYTGRHLVEVLIAHGAEVCAHVRPDSRSLESWQEHFGALGAEVSTAAWTSDAIRDALTRFAPTHVFLLLGTTKARARRGTGSAVDETYEAVDYGLSSLTISATVAAAPNARIVYLSSLGVKEGTSNAYLAARARVERELRDGPLDWIVVRPSFISGEDRGESRPAERVAAVASGAFIGALRLVGARSTANNLRARTGRELAEDIALAALRAESGQVLEGDELDALQAEG